MKKSGIVVGLAVLAVGYFAALRMNVEQPSASIKAIPGGVSVVGPRKRTGEGVVVISCEPYACVDTLKHYTGDKDTPPTGAVK